MMVDVPAETGLTTPVLLLTVATAGAELDHAPPDVAFVKVVLCPIQTNETPELAPIEVVTVTATT